jgi:uncharacterized OB-fold protein
VPVVIPPGIDRGNEWFWTGVEEDRLLIQRCASCGQVRHPGVPMCGACQSLEWDAVDAVGRGRIVTWIISHHPTEPDAEPRLVALIELEEGVRLVSNIVDAAPGAVDNGSSVELTFATYDGVTLPQFRLAGS